VPRLLLLAIMFGDWLFAAQGSVPPPSSLTEVLTAHFKRALQRATVEQEVEDHNALSKLDNTMDRQYIVMPMTDAFDPPPGSFNRGHIQMGDKMSLPKSIWTYIRKEQLESPWQFELEVIKSQDEDTDLENENAGTESLDNENPDDENKEETEQITDSVDTPAAEENLKKKKPLERVYGSILDFRAPDNFIFIPDWMMKSLRLRPRDVVRMRHLVLPQGGLVKFQPHSSDFLKLSNHQAIMENELKHYSCLTTGTTISFKYRNKMYQMDVVEVLSGGKPVDMVCVQDCDIATDFLPALDTIKNKRPLPK